MHYRSLQDDYDAWRESLAWVAEQDALEQEERDQDAAERRYATVLDPGPRVHGGVRP